MEGGWSSRDDNLASGGWSPFSSDSEPEDLVVLDAPAASVLDAKAKKAIEARNVWRRHGRVTREQYCRLKSAVPMAVQDDIVRLYREGHTQKTMLPALGGMGHRVTSYAIKRVLRIYAFDPDAFDDEGDGIVIVRR